MSHSPKDYIDSRYKKLMETSARGKEVSQKLVEILVLLAEGAMTVKVIRECLEKEKEDVVDCLRFREIAVENQFVVVSLREWCTRILDFKVIQEVAEELRNMTYMLDDELPQINDEELIKRLEKCADRLDILSGHAKSLKVQLEG